jgi:hypothetical protein
MLNSMMIPTPIYPMSGSPLINALLKTTNVADNPFYVIALNFRTLKRLLRGSTVVSNCNKLRLGGRITTVKHQSQLLNSKQHPTYLIQPQQFDLLMASLMTLWTLMTTHHRPQHQHLHL